MVEPDGSLGSCEVTESSGSKALDTETCELMIAYARLQPVRNSEGRTVRAVQTGFINWKLPAGATALAAAAPQPPSDKPEKLICKKSKTTGSLIARTRQCLTAKQWALQYEQTQQRLDQTIGKGYNNGQIGGE